MSPALKLGAYAVALVVLLVGGFVAGRILLPGNSAAGPAAQPAPSATQGGHGGGDEHGGTGPEESGEPEEGEHGGHASADPVRGLSLEQDGFRLAGPTAPAGTDRDGKLSFKITGPDGKAITDFQVSHEKRLHLIVVRTDGTEFRHVHPTMAKDGTWSLPWRWTEAGSYRMFADFVPTTTGKPTTLGYGFDVPGDFRPAKATKISTSSTVDGYQVTLAGELKASGESALTVTVTAERQAGDHARALPGGVRPPGDLARRRPRLPARTPGGRGAEARLEVRPGGHLHRAGADPEPLPALLRLPGRRGGPDGGVRARHGSGRPEGHRPGPARRR